VVRGQCSLLEAVGLNLLTFEAVGSTICVHNATVVSLCIKVLSICFACTFWRGVFVSLKATTSNKTTPGRILLTDVRRQLCCVFLWLMRLLDRFHRRCVADRRAARSGSDTGRLRISGRDSSVSGVIPRPNLTPARFAKQPQCVRREVHSAELDSGRLALCPRARQGSRLALASELLDDL
jgi:hypothetical protein